MSWIEGFFGDGETGAVYLRGIQCCENESFRARLLLAILVVGSEYG